MTVVMHNILSATGCKVMKCRHIIRDVGKLCHASTSW